MSKLKRIFPAKVMKVQIYLFLIRGSEKTKKNLQISSRYDWKPKIFSDVTPSPQNSPMGPKNAQNDHSKAKIKKSENKTKNEKS